MLWLRLPCNNIIMMITAMGAVRKATADAMFRICYFTIMYASILYSVCCRVGRGGLNLYRKIASTEENGRRLYCLNRSYKFVLRCMSSHIIPSNDFYTYIIDVGTYYRIQNSKCRYIILLTHDTTVVKTLSLS